MLSKLRIKNYILIENIEIDFNKGFNVLSGETGAGKSIILGALKLICGARFLTENIGKYDDKVIIQGVFNINDTNLKIINDYLQTEFDNQLIINREINKQGRNICKINGYIISINELKFISNFLLKIHSQDDDRQIINSQIEMLDNYINIDISKALNDTQVCFDKYMDLINQKEKFNLSTEEISQRLDIIDFQMKDIDEIELKKDDDFIDETYEKILNSVNSLNSFTNISNLIDNDNYSINSYLSKLTNELKKISNIIDLSEEIINIEEFSFSLNSLNSKLENIAHNLEYEASNLDELEKRFNKINNLKRKYGKNIEKILEFRKKLDDDFYELSRLNELKEKLDFEIQNSLNEYNKKASILSNIRKDFANKLEKEMVKELSVLNFENPKFKIEFTKKEKPSRNGIDECEFLVSLNPGMEFASLKKVASGGEKSRLSLALEKIIVKDYDITMIFDEIDTGISGKTANIIARKMYEISKKNQLIIITHLVQVVLYADKHFFIEKKRIDNFVKTYIYELNYTKKIEEIARLIGLEHFEIDTIENAKNMLDKITKEKEFI